jgi:hypothetical protein
VRIDFVKQHLVSTRHNNISKLLLLALQLLTQLAEPT